MREKQFSPCEQSVRESDPCRRVVPKGKGEKKQTKEARDNVCSELLQADAFPVKQV